MVQLSDYQQELIKKIESLGGYGSLDCNLSLEDQLLACESIVESTPVEPTDNDRKILPQLNETPKENGNVNGSVNGSYKRQDNTDKTQEKHHVITNLKACNYRTSPKAISILLEQLFSLNKSKDGHWLWIAQRYTPKSINSVIAQIQKIHITGADTIQNPSAYFTDTLKKYHPKRVMFRKNKGNTT